MRGTLFLQSSYSMLKSLIPLNELVEKAKEFNYSFLALTDESLHGVKELFDLTKDLNIKPIVGITINVIEPNNDKFLVYVKNNDGYKNLLKLSKLKEEGHNFNLNDLVNLSHNLIIVSAGPDSLIDNTICYGNSNEVFSYIEKYNNVFNDFYIGLSSNTSLTKEVIIPFYKQNGIVDKYKLIRIHETTYLNEADFNVYNSFIKIENDTNKLDSSRNNSFVSSEFINNYFNNQDYNLNDFLNSVTFTYPNIKYSLPDYDTKNDLNQDEYLKDLALRGLNRRLLLNNIKEKDVYYRRLNHELDVIVNMGFSNYFLIVYDFIKYAKQNDVLVGPGRGSAAGSLVSYSLGITDIDPIKYNLLFERFLNPKRVTMPDIDIDFPDDKRDMVIEYVREKYGDNNICSISTFSKLRFKSSIRDIARVLNVEPSRTSKIIRAIENDNIDKTDKTVRDIITIASKIEGAYRQTGTHAAGIILSKEDLTLSIPMQKGAYDFNQSQFEASTLESLGLLKIDFLGLRNLTVIKEIINILKNENINIDLSNLNLNDEKTYSLLSKGDTTGIFQLESSGMRNVLKKLKPNNFEDIVATLALYRPGPMENIDVYIRRKNGEKFNYIDESLKDILKPTYGIIIYQEQIMEIARVFSGYDLFEADTLRVGISKKDKIVLREEKKRFVEKSVAKGHSKELSEEIYNYILKFANYGFNRSHSVSYALVAYWMSYLKANHYLEFMKVLLDSIIGNSSLTSSYFSELNKNGFKVIEPNINLSTNQYIIYNNSLLMPLTQVKGIGVRAYEDIYNERLNGEFTSFDDFKYRMHKNINEQQLKSLIYSGALDSFNLNRKTLLVNISLDDIEIRKFIKDYVIKEVEDYSYVENSLYELEYLGLNIKYDIFLYLKRRFKQTNYLLPNEVIKSKNSNNIVMGVIKEIRTHINKNNKKMAFINLTDNYDVIDLVIFDDKYHLINNIKENEVIVSKITKNEYNNKISYIVNDLKKIEIK